MNAPFTNTDRLSLNQITLNRLTLREAAESCVRHGLHWIAPWRNRIHEIGIKEAASVIRGHGLKVSSLCRGGFFQGQAV